MTEPKDNRGGGAGPQDGALFSLAGKVALVTGAAGFLGTHFCTFLGRAGATVVAVDVDAEQLELLVATMATEGLACEAHLADVTDKASLSRVRDEVLAELGGIDVLVNNAGIDDKPDAGQRPGFEGYPEALLQRVLQVNVAGVFLCSQVFGTPMAQRGAGSIINIGSMYSVIAPNQSLYLRPDGEQDFFKSLAYPTSKAALVGFTRSLAAYWGHAGLRVNMLSPGGVAQTQPPHFRERFEERTPLGTMCPPTDLQGALLFLASEASRYVTGANLLVDGGFSIW